MLQLGTILDQDRSIRNRVLRSDGIVNKKRKRQREDSNRVPATPAKTMTSKKCTKSAHHYLDVFIRLPLRNARNRNFYRTKFHRLANFILRKLVLYNLTQCYFLHCINSVVWRVLFILLCTIIDTFFCIFFLMCESWTNPLYMLYSLYVTKVNIPINDFI